MKNLKIMNMVSALQEEIINKREQRKEDLEGLKEQLEQLNELEEIILEMLSDVYEQQTETEEAINKLKTLRHKMEEKKRAHKQLARELLKKSKITGQNTFEDDDMSQGMSQEF